MARIENSNPKESSGGYTRLFGNKELGKLMTKIQSAVISNGTELEKMINTILENNNQLITDVDEFFSTDIIHLNKVFVIPKTALKKSRIIDFMGGSEPDFVILKLEKETRHCYIVELKDGYIFDTKKSAGENIMKTNENILDILQDVLNLTTANFDKLQERINVLESYNKQLAEQLLTEFKKHEPKEISVLDLFIKVAIAGRAISNTEFMLAYDTAERMKQFMESKKDE